MYLESDISCTCLLSLIKNLISDLFIHMQTGFMVQTGGKEMHVYGTVLVLLADTLAAHQLGGFKVGVGFSLRKCRECMVTFNAMQTKVTNTDCILLILLILNFYWCTL